MENESTTSKKEELLMSVNDRLAKIFPRTTDISKASVFFTEYGGWYKEKVCEIRFNTSKNYMRVHRIAKTYETAASDALRIVEEMATDPEYSLSTEMN